MSILKEFFSDPKSTGAIMASGKRLSKLMVNTAQLSNKKCVVELWPWTWVFTKEIIKKVSSWSLFLGIEINSSFVKNLNKRYPDTPIYNASANDIKKYLLKNNKKNCDCIISGIPWAALNQNIQEKLLNDLYESLEDWWDFLTFAYIHGLALPTWIKFKKLLNQKFKKIEKTRIVWGNLPPAFVYRCTK